MIITTQKLNEIEEKLTNLSISNVHFIETNESFTYNQLKTLAEQGKIIILKQSSNGSNNNYSFSSITYSYCTLLQGDDSNGYNAKFGPLTQSFYAQTPTEIMGRSS